MPHIVWDRNGTLFHDQPLVVEGLNAVLDDAGIPRVDLATYQRLSTRPLRRLYERVFARPIDDVEWQPIDDVFHAAYRAAIDHAELAADAQPAIDTLTAAGVGQSLLSMWRHDELVPLVSRLGIAERFTRGDGLRGTGGGVKAPYLAAHLQGVDQPVDNGEVVVIGDALDDAAAAAQVGARCILYDGGSHPRADLERAGVSVASTLTEARRLAGPR